MLAKKLVRLVSAIAGLILPSLVLVGGARAAQVDRHFWPTPVTLEDPEETGYLWAWPEYQILLQEKDAQGRYWPAAIGDNFADELGRIFKPASGSVIRIVRDATAKTWGLEIPGGHVLRAENSQMLQPMALDFVNCLSTLAADELAEMKQVLNLPRSFVNDLDQRKKDIAARMLSNYKADRCQNGATPVPDLTKSEVKRYLTTLLTGESDGRVLDGDLLVLTSLYHDLLFATEGLWVRGTLAVLRAFIVAAMSDFPMPTRQAWLDVDYSSFVDFVLLTRDNSGLSKAQYLELASICGVSLVNQVFSPFPLKQCSTQHRVVVVRLVLGTATAVHFVRDQP